MNKYMKLLLSLPKSMITNLRFLPLKKAVRLPILVSYKTKVVGGGKIILPDVIKPGMFRVGFHEVPICNLRDETILIVKGTLICKGTFHVGNGSKIRVENDAQLTVGDNFGISASSTINCYKRIIIGNDVLLAWNVLLMDSDTHPIFDDDNIVINEGREIVFGDKVWVGCNTTILKGSQVPSNCVVGANSLVAGHNFASHTIISGNPASSRKHIGHWEEHLKGFK